VAPLVTIANDCRAPQWKIEKSKDESKPRAAKAKPKRKVRKKTRRRENPSLRSNRPQLLELTD